MLSFATANKLFECESFQCDFCQCLVFNVILIDYASVLCFETLHKRIIIESFVSISRQHVSSKYVERETVVSRGNEPYLGKGLLYKRLSDKAINHLSHTY